MRAAVDIYDVVMSNATIELVLCRDVHPSQPKSLPPPFAVSQPECADLDKIVAKTIAERSTLERARTGTSLAAGRPRGTTVHSARIDSVESIA